MHRIISMSFSCLYLLAMLRPVQPFLYYYLNHDYIAKYLCLNKEKPKMHCNGKCYLMKGIKKQHQTSNKNPKRTIELENYPIGFVFILNLHRPLFKNIPIGPQLNSCRNQYSFLYIPSLFHPPRV